MTDDLYKLIVLVLAVLAMVVLGYLWDHQASKRLDTDENKHNKRFDEL